MKSAAWRFAGLLFAGLCFGFASTPSLACGPEAGQLVEVRAISPLGDIQLASGGSVRLAGVAWPVGLSARRKMQAELGALLLHERVLVEAAGAENRWGIRAAQVFVESRRGGDPLWIQGQLVEDGLLHAWPDAVARRCWPALAERVILAQQGGLGVWSVLGRRQELRTLRKPHAGGMSRRVVFEGQVRSVRKGRTVTFVNFEGPRGRAASLFVNRKNNVELNRLGRDPATFAGKRLRVWGEAASQRPPRLIIASGDALEVLE